MVFDVAVVIVLRHREPCPYKTANLTDKHVCVLTAPLAVHALIALLTLRLPSSLRHNSIEVTPISKPMRAWRCSSERKGYTSLSLNQKLEMIKLPEEGVSKAKTGRYLGLLCQTAKLGMRRKSFEKT